MIFKVAATVALAGACAAIVLSRRRAGLTEAYLRDAADLFELGRQVERTTARRG